MIEIVADRIRLRLIESSDLHAIHALHSLPETDAFNALGIPENLEVTQSIITPWIQEHSASIIKNYTFAIEKKSNAEFMGLFGFKLGNEKYRRGEVWYKIHSEFWKRGYATESLNAILNFGFNTLQLHRIEAGCAVGNTASIRVLEKVGMIREGQKREVLPLKSGWSDNFEYAILDTDDRSEK